MAGSGVNIKMGVSGVAQFKQNIRTAQQSVKTLDEQLKLTEKEFKANGDQQEYMAKKTELLQKKIEEQKAIVSQAEKALKQMADGGVDKASDAFQKMQQQLLRAKSDLLDAETNLRNVDTAGDEAADGVSEMNSQLQRIGKDVGFKTVTDGLDSITSKLESAAKKAYQMGAALVNATLGAGEWADELVTTAEKYSTVEHTITPEQLQRMRYTATVIDTDVDTIISAQKKLRKAMGNEKSEETMGAFAALGIDPTNMDWEDAFWKAGEALRNLSNDVEREEYATKLFGKSFDDLNPLFKAGRDQYEETMDSWTVVSDSAIEKLTTMNDQQEKLNNAWTTTQNELLSTLAGPLTTVMEKLTGFLEEFNKYLQTDEGQEQLKAITDAVSSLFTDLANVDPAEVMEKIKGVIDGLVDGLKWISEHHQDVVNGLKAIVLGWGGLKLTGGALSILNLLNGLGLIGGKGAGAAAAGASAASGGGGSALGAVTAGIGTKLGLGGVVALQGAVAAGSLYGMFQAGNKLLYGGENDENLLWNDTDQAIHDDIELHGGWTDDMLDEMEKLAEGDQASVKSTSEMTKAAGDMKGLPQATAIAVRNELAGMQIVLDGEAVGRMVTGRVGGNMYGIVTRMIN